jgi:reactive intermediate/imine deaminase
VVLRRLEKDEAMQIIPVSSNNPKPLANYTEAFRVGDLVFAAGQLATDFKVGIPESARRHPQFPFYGSDIKLQTQYILENLARTFEAAGSSLQHVIKAQVFLTDLNDFSAFDEVWKQFFKTPPARTTVETTGLLIKDALIEIDLIGYVSRPGLAIDIIKSGLPAPIAHYTEAFKVGNMIFAAGQLATDFKTGVPASARKHPEFPFYGSDIKLQTEYILKNLAETFAAADATLDDVVKAQVFLTNLSDFAGFDEVWRSYFKTPPARTTIATSGLLIKDALIEIDVIGHISPDGQRHAIGKTSSAEPYASYSMDRAAGDLVFAGGRVATDFKAGIAVAARRDPNFPFYGSDVKLQTDYILKDLARSFEGSGFTLDDVVKAQVFMTDLAHFSAFDEVWKQHFKVPPARTTVGTPGLIINGGLVEIDLIAAKRS